MSGEPEGEEDDSTPVLPEEDAPSRRERMLEAEKAVALNVIESLRRANEILTDENRALRNENSRLKLAHREAINRRKGKTP